MLKLYRSLLVTCAAVTIMACPGPKPPVPPVDSTGDTTVIITPPPVDTSAAVTVSLGGDNLAAVISVTNKNGTPVANSAVSIGLAPKGQGSGAATTDATGAATIQLPEAGSYIACARVGSGQGIVYCSTAVTFPLN